MNKNLLGWILFIALSLLALFIIFSSASAAPEQNPPLPTEPSYCQYPGRHTNTPEHCDNSDPAVPECIKAMGSEQAEKDCIDAFVKAHEETATSQNTITPEKEQGK